MIPFAAYTAAETRNAFQWSGQPPKIAPSRVVILTWFMTTLKNSISIGSTVFVLLTNGTNRQADRQITLYSVCSSRLHLAMASNNTEGILILLAY